MTGSRLGGEPSVRGGRSRSVAGVSTAGRRPDAHDRRAFDVPATNPAASRPAVAPSCRTRRSRRSLRGRTPPTGGRRRDARRCRDEHRGGDRLVYDGDVRTMARRPLVSVRRPRSDRSRSRENGTVDGGSGASETPGERGPTGRAPGRESCRPAVDAIRRGVGAGAPSRAAPTSTSTRRLAHSSSRSASRRRTRSTVAASSVRRSARKPKTSSKSETPSRTRYLT